MKRRMLVVLTSLLVLMVGGVDGVGQTKRVPMVWLIDETPNNFGDFWNPYINTIKNLRIGDRLRIYKDWNGVYNDKVYGIQEGDVWVGLYSAQDKTNGGWVYSMIYGYLNGSKQPVYERNLFHFCYGANETNVLSSSGYQYGNVVVQYFNQRLGR